MEQQHFSSLEVSGTGFVAFSPLAQGLLTDKYLNGIPEGSRAARPEGFLQTSQVTPEVISKVSQLNEIAQQRGETLAEMSLAWLLRNRQVTSVIVGASRLSQLQKNIDAQHAAPFSAEELRVIDDILR